MSSTKELIIAPAYRKHFLMAGRARFYLKNSNTGNTFQYHTYRIAGKDSRAFIVLSGGVKILRVDPVTSRIHQYGDVSKQRSFEVIRKVYELILSEQPLPDTLIVLQQYNHCAYCGRLLEDELSMKIGIGPKCRKRVGLVKI